MELWEIRYEYYLLFCYLIYYIWINIFLGYYYQYTYNFHLYIWKDQG